MDSIDSMDIVQEIQTPTTEKSPNNSPSPPIPKNPLPSTPTAQPPTTPPDPMPQITTVADRQILQPVPPSKRVLPEALHSANEKNIKSTSSFLPQELAEIVAIRQRRERAWHTRIMICTSAISSIESMLAGFQDEVGKEEASAFQT